MPNQPRKWILELPDDEEDMVRVLKIGTTSAVLKYIAMTETDAKELITALEWLESFRDGMVGIPAVKVVRKRPVRKPKTLVLELEKPKRPRK